MFLGGQKHRLCNGLHFPSKTKFAQFTSLTMLVSRLKNLNEMTAQNTGFTKQKNGCMSYTDTNCAKTSANNSIQSLGRFIKFLLEIKFNLDYFDN